MPLLQIQVTKKIIILILYETDLLKSKYVLYIDRLF